MGLEDVRARLKDRQTKDGALGTEETWVCLDLELVKELEQLQEQLAMAESSADPDAAAKPAKVRLSGPQQEAEPSEEVLELREQLTAKEDEVRKASLRLVFRSLGSSRYQAIANAHPDGDDDNQERVNFLNDLAAACLHQVWADGELIDGLAWDEVREELSYGEWDETTLKVYALNRRKVDVPFSLRSSKQSRS